jgi:ACS family tartrate transporter-like MFS transporter
LYLGYWFRQREKAQAIALILVGMPLASMLGAPISGFIMDHIRWFGLSSWRWLLVLEGLPAIACVFLTNRLLPNRPAEATFLNEEEKAWLAEQLAREEQQKLGAGSLSVARTVVDPRVWYLACMCFAHAFGGYTFSFWLPQILQARFAGHSSTVVGAWVMVPNLLGLFAMVLVSRHSDQTVERRYHMAASGALAGLAFLLLGASESTWLSVVLLSGVAVGMYSFLPVFFSLPGQFLSGFSAAAGIALVTSVANLGGFVGPYTVGLINHKTGSPDAGLVWAGLAFLVSASLAAVLPKQAVPAASQPRAATGLKHIPKFVPEE